LQGEVSASRKRKRGYFEKAKKYRKKPYNHRLSSKNFAVAHTPTSGGISIKPGGRGIRGAVRGKKRTPGEEKYTE